MPICTDTRLRRLTRSDRRGGPDSSLGQPKHILNLLGSVLFGAAENVRLGAFGVAEFMDLGLRWKNKYMEFSAMVEHDIARFQQRDCLRMLPSSRRVNKVVEVRTIVPKVINPTQAWGGSKLKLMTSESLRACKSSSLRQVSTTYKKMGGICAARLRLYSMVVYFESSSGGRLLLEMSL